MARIVKLLWRIVIIYQWYDWWGFFEESYLFVYIGHICSQLQTAKQYLKSSTNNSSIWVLFPTETAKVFKELGDVELSKEEFKNALDFYTQGIDVKCKDDQLNAELYLCRWLSNCHLGEFILTSECKLSVLITVHSFLSVLVLIIWWYCTLFDDFR